MSDELRAAATLFALMAVMCLTVTAAAGAVALTATAPADTPADPTPTPAPDASSDEFQNVTEQLSTPELPHNCDWKRSAIQIEPCQSPSA